jgi:hypothetical protein
MAISPCGAAAKSPEAGFISVSTGPSDAGDMFPV